MNFVRTISFLFILFNIAVAQNKLPSSIPVDTSFNINSAEKNVKKKYPFANRVILEKTKKVIHLENLVYRDYNDRTMHLDLFIPNENTEKIPAVIFVHGGGWHSGNKSLQFPLAQKISSFGYVTAAVEYRLSGEKEFPAAIIDVKSAIKWLKINCEKYNIDTTKMVVAGCSAGGQIASLTGMTNGDRKFEDDYLSDKVSSNVNAILNIDGLVDFTGPESKEYDKDPKKPKSAHIWLGSSYKDDPDIWKYASPIYHFNENCVPFLFINSSNPHYHSGRDALIKKLDRHKIYYEIHVIGNTPHPFWLFHPWFEKTVFYIKGFLTTIF